jgi:ubiquinol-cytochrome c reductase cytochrome c subunit
MNNAKRLLPCAALAASIVPLTAFAATIALVIALSHAVSAQTPPPPGDAKAGHAAFISEGCYECHGYAGEGTGSRAPGGIAPNLAPHPIAYRSFLAQLRKPRDRMPVFSARILSNQTAADIYAYLTSIPPGKPASAIPLLNSLH